MTARDRTTSILPESAVLAALVVGAAAHPAMAQEGYFDRAIPPAYCQQDDDRKEVLLLGSYHMSNPGADRFNLEADDVLAPERQTEIQRIVDRLESFEPTHVAVEAPWGDSATVARYRAYAAGGGELRKSEEEQIGFRLARARGLETVHPIDVRMGLDFEAVGRVASGDPRLARNLGALEAVGEEVIRVMGEKLAGGSIGAMLHWMNRPENLQRAYLPYVAYFVPIVVGEDYAGADMVAGWYQRNLRIFANLTRVATEPDARVFVVFGQGHVPILRELAIQHPDFCVENPLPYLFAAPATGPALHAQGATGEQSLTDRYREAAGRLIGAALTDQEGWEKLEHLSLHIGPRLSGSPRLEEAIRWASERMREEGLENVRLQPVMVPHWVRGRESARLVAPVERDLEILGLGNSVGTPPEGIEAPVLVVGSFEELRALGRENVEGRIVLYAVEWEGYGRTVRYRVSGPSEAAKLGAVAVMVRSATGRSLYTPHTGTLVYAEDAPRIPAAAVTVEDAAWMRRLAEAGERLRVRLSMEARMLPDARSHNVIAEIVGSERPEEVVVMGGHYDSWDVGHGAHDDGAACMAAWHALTLIHRLGLRPRRTLRVVLWTNEENGGRGAQAYRDSLGDDVANHVAAIEMDGGAERPVGFGIGLGAGSGGGPSGDTEPDPALEAAMERLREIARLLEAIGGGRITAGGGGADIAPLMREGVPGLAFRTVGEHYFDWHHTNADTIDKVEPENFRRAMAMLAVMGYALADMPGRLGATP